MRDVGPPDASAAVTELDLRDAPQHSACVGRGVGHGVGFGVADEFRPFEETRPLEADCSSALCRDPE